MIETDEPPDDLSVARALGRLGPCAASALRAAREVAVSLGHGYVGTEHLIVGLAKERDGVAARALGNLSLTAETIYERVRFVGGRGNEAIADPAQLPMSPRLRHVLVAADGEAARRGQLQIGTIHLLVSLVRERTGLAVVLLHVPGVGLERIGAEILRSVREGAHD